MTHYFEKLPDRGIMRISGEDAEHFLDNLVTCKITGLNLHEARFGALLTPQGKIMFDFFLIKLTDGFLVDTQAELSETFYKRLLFYRLRAKVEIDILTDMQVVSFQGQSPEGTEFSIQDPRHVNLNQRAYGKFEQVEDGSQYHNSRIQCCIPEGGYDFEYGDAYPHEVLMDQFEGVDFKKGCYVGQEVVSRMQHRGTAKKRVIKVSAETDLPDTGTAVTADGKPAGVTGTTNGTNGLAMLRLDRAEKAEKLMAGDIQIAAIIPDWVSFSWPEAR
ncbi:MAG: folate-binding protein [Pseudomonadota bacterium]